MQQELVCSELRFEYRLSQTQYRRQATRDQEASTQKVIVDKRYDVGMTAYPRQQR